MPQSLSGLDAAFLYLETPDTPLHVAQACVFDPFTGSEPGRPPIEDVRELILRRLSRVPPFQQVPVAAPAGLGRPVWAEDPDFDVDYHLRRAALPAPAGLDELAGFTAEFLSRPLDRRRPLWEMRVIEGLPDGTVAGITKIHHSAIDGVSQAAIGVARCRRRISTRGGDGRRLGECHCTLLVSGAANRSHRVGSIPPRASFCWPDT